MKSEYTEFLIPFVGLKLGKHTFEFEIGDTFFEGFEYSIVQKGKLTAFLDLEKKETMLLAHFRAEGVVITECDRCTSDMEMEIQGEFTWIYKFGTEESEDENLIVLHPDEYQIDVKDPIYELITVSLPTRKIHPLGECDEEMWGMVQKHLVNINDEEEEDDFEDDDDDTDEIEWPVFDKID